MIYIYDLFHLIAFDQKIPFCVYSNDYHVKMPEITAQNDNHYYLSVDYKTYTYGDLIIEASNTRYTFKGVYSAYDYANKLITAITNGLSNNRHEDILISMEELNSYWLDHCGDFIVEHL